MWWMTCKLENVQLQGASIVLARRKKARLPVDSEEVVVAGATTSGVVHSFQGETRLLCPRMTP